MMAAGFVQLSTWCATPPASIPQMREAQMAALALPNVSTTTLTMAFNCPPPLELTYAPPISLPDLVCPPLSVPPSCLFSIPSSPLSCPLLLSSSSASLRCWSIGWLRDERRPRVWLLDPPGCEAILLCAARPLGTGHALRKEKHRLEIAVLQSCQAPPNHHHRRRRRRRRRSCRGGSWQLEGGRQRERAAERCLGGGAARRPPCQLRPATVPDPFQ